MKYRAADPGPHIWFTECPNRIMEKPDAHIERIKAYRAYLKSRGRLREVQAVDRCLEILRGKHD